MKDNYKTSGWSALTTENILSLSLWGTLLEVVMPIISSDGFSRLATIYDSPMFKRKLSLNTNGFVSLTKAPYPMPKSLILYLYDSWSKYIWNYLPLCFSFSSSLFVGITKSLTISF